MTGEGDEANGDEANGAGRRAAVGGRMAGRWALRAVAAPIGQDAGVTDTLEPGIERTDTYTVTPEMAPGHLPVVVLSTPSMVQLIEATCLAAAAEHLGAGQLTVGTHICVSHDAPAFEGEQVTVTGRLTERDGRRLTFAVQVTGPRGTLSTGTHRRAIVDADRFG